MAEINTAQKLHNAEAVVVALGCAIREDRLGVRALRALSPGRPEQQLQLRGSSHRRAPTLVVRARGVDPELAACAANGSRPVLCIESASGEKPTGTDDRLVCRKTFRRRP